MASWDDVREIALGLPEVEEGTSYGNQAWKLRKDLLVWRRPLTKKETAVLGDAAPPADAPILGVRVPDEEAKAALLASEPDVYFTTPHFDGHLSVLVRLDRIPRSDLKEAIVEAWLMRAPKSVASEYLKARG